MMSAIDNAKKYLSLRPPMENKTIFALHPDVLVEGLLQEVERLQKKNDDFSAMIINLVGKEVSHVKVYKPKGDKK